MVIYTDNGGLLGLKGRKAFHAMLIILPLKNHKKRMLQPDEYS